MYDVGFLFHYFTRFNKLFLELWIVHNILQNKFMTYSLILLSTYRT